MVPGGIPNWGTLKWGSFCCNQTGRDWNAPACNEDGRLTGWMAAADIKHRKSGPPAAVFRRVPLSRGEDGRHGKGDFRAAVFTPTWNNSSSPLTRTRQC